MYLASQDSTVEFVCGIKAKGLLIFSQELLWEHYKNKRWVTNKHDTQV
jgi:hypothetical protein